MKVNYFLEVITSKVYGRHPDLDNRHGVSMSQMTTDMSNCCCSRNQKPVLSLFMTYYPVCNKSNSKGDACGSGTVYPSRALAFTPVLVRFVLPTFSFLCKVL
jgi:hypothetical protein